MKYVTGWIAGLALLFFPLLGHAQPTIDGSIEGDEDAYIQLAEWTQDDTGFGPHGMVELYAVQQGDMLYVNAVGEVENNGNAFFIGLDASSLSGVPAGAPLPSAAVDEGPGGARPFNAYQAAHDFETDYGMVLRGTSDSTAAMSLVNYVADTTDSGQSPHTYLTADGDTTFANDGSAVALGGDFDGASVSYTDTGSLDNHTGVEAWEFAIPLSALGVSAGDELQLLGLYVSGNGDFVSANTLPEIEGQSGTNLEGNPDFTQIDGDQHTAPSTLQQEQVTTIAEARSAALEDTVLTEGVVTRAFGSYVRIQDDTGALQIRQTGGDLSTAFQDTISSGAIQRGTTLRVRGALGQFSGLVQINNEGLLDFEIVSQDNALPAVQDVSFSDLTGESGEAFESELVSTPMFTINADGDTNFQSGTTYTITDGDGNEFDLRIQDDAETNVIGEPIPSGQVVFTGVVGQFNVFNGRDVNEGYQLIPVQPTDLQEQRAPLPTVDGQTTDGRYLELGTSPAEPGADFTGGLLTLNAFSGPDSLYVAVEGKLRAGEGDGTFREIMVFMNASSTSGIASGTPLPPGDDGLSPFIATDSMTMDMETDYGVRITGGDDPQGFVSFVNYVSFDTTSSSASDSFEATVSSLDGTPVSGGATDGSYAYLDADSLGSVDGSGFEFAIPHSALGTSQGDDFEFFAFYGDVEGDNIAATLIPDDGTTATYGNSEDWTAVSGMQTTGSQVLPVEMASFDVTADTRDAVLNWETASETNNAGFEVQHATNDGRFQTVGFVEGAGTTQKPQSYRFRVSDLEAGAHQFRLKQMDLDGSASLSAVRTVTVSMDRSLVFEPIAPNPVTGTASFSFATREAQPVTVEVYNVLGQRVATLFNGRLSGGQTQSVQIDASDLVSGTYFVRIKGASVNETRRMTVVK